MAWLGTHTLLLLLSSFVLAASASSVVDVWRLLQADIDGGSIGSQHYSAKGFLTLPYKNAKTLRAVMGIPLSPSHPASSQPFDLQEYVARRSGLEALLIIVPQPMDSGSSYLLLRKLEQQLLGMPVHIPVYFAPETPELRAAVQGTQEMFDKGLPPSQSTDRYELSIQGVRPGSDSGPQPLNYLAVLSGTEDRASEGPAKTILLTAHYDAISPAPRAPQGTNSNASGVAALLALLRAFYELYQSPETRPAHNLMFLFASGGSAGHAGLKQWLSDADPAVIESIAFALSLDTVGSSNLEALATTSSSSSRDLQKLYLHSSSSSSSDSSSGVWKEALQSAAERVGLPLQSSQAAAAADAEASAAWAHEQLAARGIPAATLSALSVPPPLGVLSGLDLVPEQLSLQQRAFEGLRVGTLGDSLDGVEVQGVLEAAQVAGEAVVKLLYPKLEPGLRLVDLTGPTGGAAARPLVAAWLGLLTRGPRMHPLDHVSEEGAALHKALRGFLKDHSNSFRRHMWPFEAAAPRLAAMAVKDTGVARLQVYFSGGTGLDLLLLAGVIVYLCGLFATLRIVTSGWDEFARMWTAGGQAGGRGKGGKGR